MKYESNAHYVTFTTRAPITRSNAQSRPASSSCNLLQQPSRPFCISNLGTSTPFQPQFPVQYRWTRPQCSGIGLCTKQRCCWLGVKTTIKDESSAFRLEHKVVTILFFLFNKLLHILVSSRLVSSSLQQDGVMPSYALQTHEEGAFRFLRSLLQVSKGSFSYWEGREHRTLGQRYGRGSCSVLSSTLCF